MNRPADEAPAVDELARLRARKAAAGASTEPVDWTDRVPIQADLDLNANSEEPDDEPDDERACGYRIVAIGGEDRSGAPPAYVEALRALFAEMCGPAWLAWWAGADTGVLELWYHVEVASAACTVRRRDDVIVATVCRPLETIPSGRAATGAARDLAHRDVSRLVHAVGSRMWLENPPRLPPAAALGAALDAAAAAVGDRVRRLTRLLDALDARLPADVHALLAMLEPADAPAGPPHPEAVEAVLDALYVRVLTGAVTLTADEAAELHDLAGGPPAG